MNEQELKVGDIKALAEKRVCTFQKALYYITEFLRGPMCGRCFPCAFGSYEVKVRLENIIKGSSTEVDISVIKRIAINMLEASMCKKGKDSAKFMLEWVNTDAYKEHIEGRCGECITFVEYRVIPERCIMCGTCRDICRYNAILGEKRKPYLGIYLPFEIRQKRCRKCGQCINVCPREAIIRVFPKEMEDKCQKQLL